MLKLHHLLEQEADELKRLLGAKAGAISDQPDGANDNATRATLARLKKDLASRRLHEAAMSASEVCVYRPGTQDAVVHKLPSCRMCVLQ